MIGIMVSQEILMAHHQCQAMTHFELNSVKNLIVHDLNPQPTLTLFAVMTPHLFQQNSFISHP
jgi:hypothetical protein